MAYEMDYALTLFLIRKKFGMVIEDLQGMVKRLQSIEDELLKSRKKKHGQRSRQRIAQKTT